jgi:hypothetical protein
MRLKNSWHDKFKNHCQWLVNNYFKNQFIGVIFGEILSILGLKKNRRFVIFRVTFYRFWPLLGAIRIYRKTAPTKSTVLGPGPPPWDFYKFYRFLRFFTFFGPSIEPEKVSVKSASTPYPPWKVIFMVNLSKIMSKMVLVLFSILFWSLA